MNTFKNAVFCVAILYAVPSFAMSGGDAAGVAETLSGSGSHVFADAVNLNASGGVIVPNANIHTGPTYHFSSDSMNTPRDQQLPFRDRLLNTIEQGYIQLLSALAVQVSYELVKAAVAYGYNRLTAGEESQESSDTDLFSAEKKLLDDLLVLQLQEKFVKDLEEQLEQQEAHEKTEPITGQDAAKIAEMKADIRKNIAAMRMSLLQKTHEASSRMRTEVVGVFAAEA